MHYEKHNLNLGYHSPLALISIPWILGARRGINIYTQRLHNPISTKESLAFNNSEDEIESEKRETLEKLTIKEGNFQTAWFIQSGTNRSTLLFMPKKGITISPWSKDPRNREPILTIPLEKSIQLGHEYIEFAKGEARYGKYQDLIPEYAALLGQIDLKTIPNIKRI